MAFAGLAVVLAIWRCSLHERRGALAFGLAAVYCGVMATWWEMTPRAPAIAVALTQLVALIWAYAVAGRPVR